MEQINQNDNILSVENLVVHYTANEEVIEAVNGISFSLQKGKTLGLVGETGAGKTTIAKSILRILPDPPAKIRGGKILFDGMDLLSLPEVKMRKVRGDQISMIFQDPMTALNPIKTIGDQIKEVICLHQEGSRKEAEFRAIEMLEMVGISGDRYGEYPHQFSGGMKQRVIIAMALACNPKLLLADEPTTALDVTIQAQVLRMIKKLQNEFKTSMIMITHDLGIVANVCDDVAVVYAGQIIEQGSKEDLFDRPTHPYTKGLFASLPSLSGDETRLNPIPGLPPNPADLPRGCKFAPRCKHATDACREKEIPLYEISPGHFLRCCEEMKGGR